MSKNHNQCDGKLDFSTCDTIEPDLIDAKQAIRLSDFFKLLSDKTRLRILDMLHKQDYCVHEIAQALDMSQSAISHQLKTLRDANIVEDRKVGKHIFYTLIDNKLKAIFEYIEQTYK